MDSKTKKVVSNIKTAHIQNHNYPSRREIIEKCESGSAKPILTNEGRGRTLDEMKQSNRNFRANWDRAFGKRT